MTRTILMVALVVVGLSCASYRIDLDEDGGDPDGSAGGGGGGTGGGGGSGGGAGGGEEIDAGFEVCADEGGRIALKPLDLLVLLDVSYSMDYDLKWISVKSAMKSFVSKPEFSGLGVGLQYFPLRAQCSLAAYQSPAVAIGVLPAIGATVSASLDQQQMQGGTPTVPALEGVVAYVQTWAAQHPTHKSVIVIATDGVPDDTCAGASVGLANSLANACLVASGAATSSPAINTFVIGVGRDLTALDQLARAGGTNNAILVDTSANADVAFLEALTQIRRDSLGCSFPVAHQTGVDPLRARVRFTPDTGGELKVPRVGDRSGCTSGIGWYFDDPNIPTRVVLCDSTCDVINQGLGVLHVEFACGVN